LPLRFRCREDGSVFILGEIGALALWLGLGLGSRLGALVPIAYGVVSERAIVGDVEQFSDAPYVLPSYLVDQLVVVEAFEKGLNDSVLGEADKRVLLGEALDVVAKGLIAALGAGLQVVLSTDHLVSALKIADEDLAEVGLAEDVVSREVAEPGPRRASQAKGQVSDCPVVRAMARVAGGEVVHGNC
jgi:hypothetical protein